MNPAHESSPSESSFPKNVPPAKASSDEDSFDKIEKEIMAVSHSRRPPPVSAALALSAAQPQGNIVIRQELVDMTEGTSPPTMSEGFA